MDEYYDNGEYYSFSEGIEDIESLDLYGRLKRALRLKVMGGALFRFYARKELADTKRRLEALHLVNKKDRIVDIGCGGGRFVNSLRALGFSNVIGIDPYLASSVDSAFGVPLCKASLEELDGKWDQIWLTHSLEHMPNPEMTIRGIAEKLDINGTAIISLPICDSYDYEEYGSDWAGCDAPVHLFLHTRKSLEILYKKAGLAASS